MGSEEKPEQPQPIKSLHDFFLDVEKELEKFRAMAILGVVASIIILFALGRFIFILYRFSPRFPRGAFRFDLILIILALVFLFYSVYALFGQSAFLKRWGKRFKQLDILERKLLEEEK